MNINITSACAYVAVTAFCVSFFLGREEMKSSGLVIRYLCVNGKVDEMKYPQLRRYRSRIHSVIEIRKLYWSSKENLVRMYWFSDPPATMQFVGRNLLFLHRQTVCEIKNVSRLK
jgi:hypothetical protein